jgi:hypothetical protein
MDLAIGKCMDSTWRVATESSRTRIRAAVPLEKALLQPVSVVNSDKAENACNGIPNNLAYERAFVRLASVVIIATT